MVALATASNSHSSRHARDHPTGVALVDSPNARLEGNRFDRAATPCASEGLRFTGNRSLGGFLRAEAPLPDVVPAAAASAPAPEASR